MTDREISMVQTGSMQKYTKGNLLLINDKPLNYAMSNIFEIGATWPKSYDRVVIAPGPHKTVTGTDMGSMVLRDGSLASLPAKIAYRMRAAKKSLALLQTKHSEWLTYAWEDICLTEA